MRYRPSLDGVRGVAIALVVGGHYWNLPPGGRVGVDLFFVLSGFLITSLLLAERAGRGRVSLREFYARRARRLLPALAALLFTYVLWVAAHGHDPFETVVLGGLYVGNVVQAFGLDHGAVFRSPLAHLWSLAQEEQFYLVWPLLLLTLVRTRRPARWLAGLFAALVVYRVVLVLAGASLHRIDYAPDTRADGLVAGALLAVAGTSWAAEWAGKTGVALLVVGMLTRPATGAFLTVGLPLLELGAVLIVAAALNDTALARGLSLRPLVGLGKGSYSLYLWHLPLLYAFPGSALTRLGTLTASVACAALSYHYVEQPFRRRRVPMTFATPRSAPGGIAPTTTTTATASATAGTH